MNDRRDVVLGVDVGGSSIKWAALARGERISGGEEPTSRSGPSGLLDQILNIIRQVRPEAVGLAVPGPVATDGSFRFVPNLSGDWSAGDFDSRLRRDSGLPLTVLNDAHAHALAEAHTDPGLGDAALIVLGTGVGGALLLDGHLHLGRDGRAGEFGHIVVQPDGAVCPCGDRGCLEAYASVSAMTRDFTNRTGRPTQGDLKVVLTAASVGDEQAIAVLDRAGQAIGLAIGILAAVVAPATIVIGGGGAAALSYLKPSMDAAFLRRAQLKLPPHVRASSLGRHAGATGAALSTTELRGFAAAQTSKGIS